MATRSEYQANLDLSVAARSLPERRRAYGYQLQAKAAAYPLLVWGARPSYWAALTLALFIAA